MGKLGTDGLTDSPIVTQWEVGELGVGSRQTGPVYPLCHRASWKRVTIKSTQARRREVTQLMCIIFIAVAVILPFVLNFYLDLPIRKLSRLQPPQVGAWGGPGWNLPLATIPCVWKAEEGGGMFAQMCGPGYADSLGRGVVLVNSCSTRALAILQPPHPHPQLPHLLED